MMLTKLRMAIRAKRLSGRWREAVRAIKVSTIVKILDFSLGVLLAGAAKEREASELEHLVDAAIERAGPDEANIIRAVRRDLVAITRNPRRQRKLEKQALVMIRERATHV